MSDLAQRMADLHARTQQARIEFLQTDLDLCFSLAASRRRSVKPVNWAPRNERSKKRKTDTPPFGDFYPMWNMARSAGNYRATQ